MRRMSSLRIIALLGREREYPGRSRRARVVKAGGGSSSKDGEGGDRWKEKKRYYLKSVKELVVHAG